MRRPAALAAAVLLAAGTALAAAPAAQADALAMSACTTTANAIVAVNFAHFGGKVEIQCGSTPTTGFALLNEGAFHTTGTQHDGPGFICRISDDGSAGYPTAQQDACSRTPPASAYWSYWHAAPGSNTWSYSTLGAQSYHPVAGSVDYWQFGGTNVAGTTGRPTVTPAQVRAGTPQAGSGGPAAGGGATGGGRHTASGAGAAGPGGGAATHARHPSGAAPATSAPAGRAASSAGSGATRSSGTAATSSPAAGASGTAGTAGSARGAGTAGTGGATPASSGPEIVQVRPAAADARRPSGGSLAPVLLGVALAVLLAGGAGWTVLRRRRAGA